MYHEINVGDEIVRRGDGFKRAEKGIVRSVNKFYVNIEFKTEKFGLDVMVLPRKKDGSISKQRVRSFRFTWIR